MRINFRVAWEIGVLRRAFGAKGVRVGRAHSPDYGARRARVACAPESRAKWWYNAGSIFKRQEFELIYFFFWNCFKKNKNIIKPGALDRWEKSRVIVLCKPSAPRGATVQWRSAGSACTRSRSASWNGDFSRTLGKYWASAVERRTSHLIWLIIIIKPWVKRSGKRIILKEPIPRTSVGQLFIRAWRPL